MTLEMLDAFRFTNLMSIKSALSALEIGFTLGLHSQRSHRRQTVDTMRVTNHRLAAEATAAISEKCRNLLELERLPSTVVWSVSSVEC
jgi:hypothetical protein